MIRRKKLFSWVALSLMVAVPLIAEESKPPIRKITENLNDDDLVITGNACIGEFCGDNDNDYPTLKLKSSQPNILFDDVELPGSGIGAHDWALFLNLTGAAQFSIVDFEGALIPFSILGGAPDNSLVVDGNGHVGLGTSTPAQKLHLLGSDAATQVLVEETNATTALRTLVQLQNNGDIRLNYKNTFTGVQWGANVISGNYKLIKAGAGVTAVDVNGNGNVTIAGTLTQNSDRTTKHDIVPVQPDEILGKVLNLPIATWVRNGDEAKHLGPMAQDFSAAFGLGEDERHIATIDMAGVSLASIQALNSKVTAALVAKDTEIETLRRENSDLARRLATLEKLVSSLKEEATPEDEPAP
jgi:hypothetical protein